MKNLLLAFVVTVCAGVSAASLEGVTLKGDRDCHDGRIFIKLTLSNASGREISMLRDELPWSTSEGGAEVSIGFYDHSPEVPAERRLMDHWTKYTLHTGETSGELDVTPMFPNLRQLIKDHKNIILSWSYLLGNGTPKAIGTGGGFAIRAADDDECYKEIMKAEQ